MSHRDRRADASPQRRCRPAIASGLVWAERRLALRGRGAARGKGLDSITGPLPFRPDSRASPRNPTLFQRDNNSACGPVDIQLDLCVTTPQDLPLCLHSAWGLALPFPAYCATPCLVFSGLGLSWLLGGNYKSKSTAQTAHAHQQAHRPPQCFYICAPLIAKAPQRASDIAASLVSHGGITSDHP
jgi:hypothetical protein